MKTLKHWYVAGSIVFGLIFVVLVVANSMDMVLNIQRFADFEIDSTVFWVGFLLLGLRLSSADWGFLRLVVYLGLVFSVLMITFLVVQPEYTYESVQNDEYTLVIQQYEEHNSYYLNVYKKVNILFSEYVGSVNYGTYYDIEKSIDNQQMVVTLCTDVSCITKSVDLN